jgi:hypothetical protein
MRKTFRILVILTLTAVSLPLIAFLGYDLFEYQPRREDIQRLLAAATPEEKSPPPAMSRMLNAAYKKKDFAYLPYQAARILIKELGIYREGGSISHWHATGTLWTALGALHLSKQEQATLVYSRSYLGKGVYGYSALSQSLFQRPMSALSPSEAATLVVVSFHSGLLESPDRLAMHRDLLLDEAQNGS